MIVGGILYELRKATENDVQLLIKYKLSTIFQFADDISNNEEKEIKEYVNDSVPKLLNEYKIIVVNGHDIGCFLVTDYEDGKLIDEIYLEDEYRGKGIGTDLIFNILSKHNVAYLWVYKQNKEAIKLYKKLGFKIELETDTRYFMKHEN